MRIASISRFSGYVFPTSLRVKILVLRVIGYALKYEKWMRSDHRSWHLFCMGAIKDRSIMISILWSRNGNLGVLNGSHLEVSLVAGIYVLIFRRRCRVARRLSATSPTAFQSADAQFGRLIPRIFTRFERYNASLDLHRRESFLKNPRVRPFFETLT